MSQNTRPLAAGSSNTIPQLLYFFGWAMAQSHDVTPVLMDFLWKLVLLRGLSCQCGIILDEGSDQTYAENLRIIRERAQKLTRHLRPFFQTNTLVWPSELVFTGVWPNWKTYGALRALNREVGLTLLHLQADELYTPPPQFLSSCRSFHWRSPTAQHFFSQWHYERRPLKIVAHGMHTYPLSDFPWPDDEGNSSPAESDGSLDSD